MRFCSASRVFFLLTSDTVHYDMRGNPRFAALTLIGLSSLLTANAQKRVGPTGVNAEAEGYRIAIVYTADFLDPKTGIARVAVALESLNREFAGRQSALQDMKRLRALESEIAVIRATASPATVMDKERELNQLRGDRLAADTEQAFERRRQEILAPVYARIQQSLGDYGRGHNVQIIIDGSTVPVVYAADAVNITRAFIREFNAKNPPATGVGAP